MINTNRIVQVTAVDLISLYGLILSQNDDNAGLTALEATNAGEFAITDGTAVLIANEPVKVCDIAEDVTAATLYFVPAYDYVGFSINGVAEDIDADIEADGRTLYKAVLADSAITVTKIGF